MGNRMYSTEEVLQIISMARMDDGIDSEGGYAYSEDEILESFTTEPQHKMLTVDDAEDAMKSLLSFSINNNLNVNNKDRGLDYIRDYFDLHKQQ